MGVGEPAVDGPAPGDAVIGGGNSFGGGNDCVPGSVCAGVRCRSVVSEWEDDDEAGIDRGTPSGHGIAPGGCTTVEVGLGIAAVAVVTASRSLSRSMGKPSTRMPSGAIAEGTEPPGCAKSGVIPPMMPRIRVNPMNRQQGCPAVVIGRSMSFP